MPRTLAVYEGLCPVCGGRLSTREVEEGSCARRKVDLSRPYDVRDYSSFEAFFVERTGKEPNRMQAFWARRLLSGMSFAAVAPTGVGKTLFGLVFSCFFAEKRNKKVYLLFPTTTLLSQAVERLESISESARILSFSSGRKSEREEFFSRLEKGDFDILVTTTAFLSKNFDRLEGERFDLVFVDDVDALLKASRNVDRVLRLLGFSWREIREGEPLPDRKRGLLVVSTATAKPGPRAVLFSRLLGFSVGSSRSTIRNVEDYGIPVVEEKERARVVARLVDGLACGGLVFVPRESDGERVVSLLEGLGVRAALVSSSISRRDRNQIVRNFLEDRVSVLVGVASRYGLLVRGLDYPERIGFVVFWGAPVNRVSLEDIDGLSPKMLFFLVSLFSGNRELSRLAPLVLSSEEKREEARSLLKELLEKGELSGASRGVVVSEREVLIPDVTTYIQAGGRTSRLFAGGVTKGLCLVLDSRDVLEALRVQASYRDIHIGIVDSLDEIDLDRIAREIRESRRGYATSEGSGVDLLSPVVFVVESPTKARQIARFFGRPGRVVLDGHSFYEVSTHTHVLLVTACMGHVVDLVEKGGFHGVELQDDSFVPVYGTIKKCRTDMVQWVYGGECPRCGKAPDDDSVSRIRAIARMAHIAGGLVLATDPDTEGEKISWDLENLSAYGVVVERAEFHEVTKRAVLSALASLRGVKENRVRAQIVRRIEDRWIGFELSRILREHFGDPNLSAGRAQSPVLSWIVERYREHQKKDFFLEVRFEGGNIPLGFASDLGFSVLSNGTTDCRVHVSLLKRETQTRNPLPPYTTDSLLSDASRILRAGARETMQVLQDLFENGLITYHRTDSTRVSDRGLEVAKSFLGEDFVPRRWASGKEGAHECIRPTRPVDASTLRLLIENGSIQVQDGFSPLHYRVYDLVFRRFMASQAPPFGVTVSKYRVYVEELDIERVVERITDAEGLAFGLYPFAVNIQPPLPEGVFEGELAASLRNKVPLYSQADIVRLMREKGIGRPSTYSAIISKLFERGYIVEKFGFLEPTRKGMAVSDFLVSRYGSFVSEERTRLVEQAMDLVEEGSRDYQEVLHEFYSEIKSLETSG